jgi:hypothetical protein
MTGREQESVNIDPNLDDKVNKMIAEGDKPLEVAEAIAAAARADAPVVTGAYAAGISAEKTPHGARVIASDNKSSWIEFGIPSQNQPPQFILRRAVDSLGLKFKKGH